jgi:hypothetical protein
MSKIYIVSLTPVGVAVAEELFSSNIHTDTTYPFEVPEQEMTFGLPSGNPRVSVSEFEVLNIIGKNVKTFDIHDIEAAPELYARLKKMVLPKTGVQKSAAELGREAGSSLRANLD